MWKLKKDIVCPDVFIPSGTIGIKLHDGNYGFTCIDRKGGYDYNEEEMNKFPDFFEQLPDPKWTDEQMIAFANRIVRSSLYSMNHVQEYFDKWKKENSYE